MCIYANAFVAGRKKDSLILPKHPEGLIATFDGEKNEKFLDSFSSKTGEFLTFHDGHCLCQFSNWKTFFEFVDMIRQANEVDVLPVMIFATGQEYATLQSREIDLELDDTAISPEHGTIIYVGISVRRRLAKFVGGTVSILFKSGKSTTGTLKEYNQNEEYGEIVKGKESIFFNAAQIRHVDTVV